MKRNKKEKKGHLGAFLSIAAILSLAFALSRIMGISIGYFTIIAAGVGFIYAIIRWLIEEEFKGTLEEIRGGNLMEVEFAEFLAGKNPRRLDALKKAIKKGRKAPSGCVPLKSYNPIITGETKTGSVRFFNPR